MTLPTDDVALHCPDLSADQRARVPHFLAACAAAAQPGLSDTVVRAVWWDTVVVPLGGDQSMAVVFGAGRTPVMGRTPDEPPPPFRVFCDALVRAGLLVRAPSGVWGLTARACGGTTAPTDHVWNALCARAQAWNTAAGSARPTVALVLAAAPNAVVLVLRDGRTPTATAAAARRLISAPPSVSHRALARLGDDLFHEGLRGGADAVWWKAPAERVLRQAPAAPFALRAAAASWVIGTAPVRPFTLAAALGPAARSDSSSPAWRLLWADGAWVNLLQAPHPPHATTLLDASPLWTRALTGLRADECDALWAVLERAGALALRPQPEDSSVSGPRPLRG